MAAAKADVAVISASAISTGNGLKDKHARGESWLDVAQYPSTRFHCTTAPFAQNQRGLPGDRQPDPARRDEGRGRTHSSSASRATATACLRATFSVNRQDYGIKGNLFGFSVGDDIARRAARRRSERPGRGPPVVCA
ncbi:MAG: YceI family protein [Hymenobacter sp.]